MLLSWATRDESTAIPTDHVIMDAVTCLFGHSTTKSVHVLLALGTEVILDDGRSGKGAIGGAMRHLETKQLLIVVWFWFGWWSNDEKTKRKQVK